jgi:DNA-binding transcriptional ArsR family regulator
MLQAALWYAKRGWHVFPLHAPIFDANGACVGCTCEAWKRTHYNKPDYKCPQPGKCPAVKWADKSTVDPDQIQKWWGHQWKAGDILFTPNIGIDCGESGLLTWDRDTYKDGYADMLSVGHDQRQTVTSLTGSGGEQLLYARQGKNYSNATGDLPYGNDIRGIGGYIVAPPSLHKSGRRYQFEDGYKPNEIDLLPIPQALQTILDAAQVQSTTAKTVIFTTPITERPELIRLHISKEVRTLINTPGTGDRSANDMKVCVSLVYAGASDNDILAVFQHYPIGTDGKYAEAGQRYLALTIGKARAFVELHPRPNVSATVNALRLAIKTRNLTDHIPTGKGSKKARLVADAILDLMEIDQKLTVTAGKKRIAKYAGCDPNTAAHALTLLNGLLFDVTPSEYGYSVSLVTNCRLQEFHPSLSVLNSVNTGGEKTANDKNAYSPHKADDAFASGTSRYMRDHIKNLAQVLDVTYPQAQADYTKRGLGEGVLLAFDTWQRVGDYTAQEYAQETGLKLSAARTHLQRAEKMGLAESEREGSRGPKIYSFIPEFWEKIDELAPNMRTYRLSDQRESKRLESAQQWAQHRKALAVTPEETQTHERRFAKLAKQRLPHLERLYPSMTPKERERLAYEVAAYKRSAQTAQAIRTERTEQRTEHRDEITAIRELAVSIADIGTPLEAMFNEIMKYRVFDAGMVRDVLQSARQMANYETTEDVRKRMRQEDLTLPHLAINTAPTYSHNQLALAGAA